MADKGHKVKINYGEFKGRKGVVVETSPSNAFATVRVNKSGGRRIMVNQSDLTVVTPNHMKPANEQQAHTGRGGIGSSFDESQHPRHPSGNSQGGEFRKK